MSSLHIISDSAEDELNALLDTLNLAGEEARALAHLVALESVQLSAAALNGEDVELGQMALVATVQNLIAATTVATAHAVLGFAERLIVRIGSLVVNAAFATL